jgi:hypothetical protein
MGKLSELVATIDVIAADIEANVQLPAHVTELYARPRGLTSEHCPALLVYSARIPWQLIATPSNYFVTPEVYVAWFLAAAQESEKAVGIGDLAKSAAETGDLIGDRIASYAEGIPGIASTWARVVESTLDRDEGLLFGVVFRLEVER